jgi:hypothetical protein
MPSYFISIERMHCPCPAQPEITILPSPADVEQAVRKLIASKLQASSKVPRFRFLPIVVSSTLHETTDCKPAASETCLWHPMALKWAGQAMTVWQSLSTSRDTSRERSKVRTNRTDPPTPACTVMLPERFEPSRSHRVS